VREPNRLSLSDQKRPDGVTLVPWFRGRYLLWDDTCPDTLAPSHVGGSAVMAGATADQAESAKNIKYESFTVSYDFVAVVIETLGPWGPTGLSFVHEIGRRITQVTGDERAAVFHRQHLFLAVQRGNAASVLGIFGFSSDLRDE